MFLSCIITMHMNNTLFKPRSQNSKGERGGERERQKFISITRNVAKAYSSIRNLENIATSISLNKRLLKVQQEKLTINPYTNSLTAFFTLNFMSGASHPIRSCLSIIYYFNWSKSQFRDLFQLIYSVCFYTTFYF